MRGAFVFGLLMGLILCGVSWKARAQNCDTQYEVVFKLRDPALGAYNVWDKLYGDEHHEEMFSYAVSAKKSRTFVAGLKSKPGIPDYTLLVMELDKRGRSQFEREYAVPGIREIVEILHTEEGYLILANRRKPREKSGIWIGFFDSQGGLRGEKSLTLEGSSLYARDMILSLEKTGYILAASAERRDSGVARYAVIYTLDKKGNVVQDRAYYPGIVNEILSIDYQGEHDYIAAGYIESENKDQEKTGWIMRLNKKAGIVWQKQYTRGKSSKIQKVRSYSGEYFVTTGSAVPYGSDASAVWTMLLESFNGQEIWQRFYTDEFDLVGKDLLVHEDGRISLMINAIQPPGSDTENYVRLLTLSPRGEIMTSDAYYNGKGTNAENMIFGPVGERILAGYSHVFYVHDPEKPHIGTLSQDAWIVAASSADAYSDPCIKPRRQVQ